MNRGKWWEYESLGDDKRERERERGGAVWRRLRETVGRERTRACETVVGNSFRGGVLVSRR